MLAVGDSGGTLHILEVPWSLSHPSSNEVNTHLIYSFANLLFMFYIGLHNEVIL